LFFFSQAWLAMDSHLHHAKECLVTIRATSQDNGLARNPSPMQPRYLLPGPSLLPVIPLPPAALLARHGACPAAAAAPHPGRPSLLAPGTAAAAPRTGTWRAAALALEAAVAVGTARGSAGWRG